MKGLFPAGEAGLDTSERDSHMGAYVELVIIYKSCINEAVRVASEAEVFSREFSLEM